MNGESDGKTANKLRNHCDICNKTIIGGSFNFKSHLYQHKIVAPRFTCPYPYCCKQYFRTDVYAKHLETHTGRKKTYICDYCAREFVDKRNLIKHLHIHDDSVRTSTTYSCMACGVKYCEERLLKYHIRKEHFNLQQKEELLDKKPLNSTWVERVLETNICVQMTKVNNNVITIKKCNTVKDETKKSNEQVNNSFTKYMNSVFACGDQSHYSKAICDYCNKEMLKKSLQNHIREKHLKLRRFKCARCKESFHRHYQMINHVCGKFRQRKRVKSKIIKC